MSLLVLGRLQGGARNGRFSFVLEHFSLMKEVEEGFALVMIQVRPLHLVFDRLSLAFLAVLLFQGLLDFLFYLSHRGRDGEFSDGLVQPLLDLKEGELLGVPIGHLLLLELEHAFQLICTLGEGHTFHRLFQLILERMFPTER